jgi:KUP system potassium uptake protein
MSTADRTADLTAGSPAESGATHGNFARLAIGSIGVVYGDIGTSPLYAFKESALAASAGAAPSEPVILGVLSLIIWALIVIVTLKYVVLLLRADNGGEGGTLSLMALAHQAIGTKLVLIPLLGIIASALFYGDAMITPAISVLSAVEGLSLVTPAFDSSVVPLSLAIMVGLFAVQSRGTGAVAAWFGPITLVWFAALAVAGAVQIVAYPAVLAAFSPTYAVAFLASHGMIGLVTLGAVFLAVTGAEALYADLGHFGRGPIRAAWLTVVFPCLALNYLGQGALVLTRPDAMENPFFRMVPEWALLPMVVLATAATIIASQAVITGAYSMTQQAIQLGLMPRLEIRRTSETTKGQIYIPRINWLLLIAVLFLVQAFRSSSALAAAYGIAVTGTMVVTAILAFIVVWKHWKWPVWAAGLLMVPFLAVDLVFLGANLLKILEGGWLPLLVGLVIMLAMLTWRRGSALLLERTRRDEVRLDGFLRSLEKRAPATVPGMAIFLTGQLDSVPTSLLHNLKHNKILHERNVILHVRTLDVPRVPEAGRATYTKLSERFATIELRFGFMESPNVPRALGQMRGQGFVFDIMQTSFFLSRRVLRPSTRSAMPRWQDKFFIWLSRRASDASAYFEIPTGRAVEIGAQIVI